MIRSAASTGATSFGISQVRYSLISFGELHVHKEYRRDAHCSDLVRTESHDNVKVMSE